MKKYKKWIAMGVIGFLIFLGFFTGYILQKQKSSTPLSLIYIPKTEDGTSDFWSSLISGARMAASEYGVQLKVMAPKNEQDVKGQVSLLKKAIEQNPDGILFSTSSNSAANKDLKKAKEKGICITYIDSCTTEELQDLTVATDNVEAGRRLGEYARTIVGKDDKIAVISHVKGVSTAVEREQGFREGLGDYEKNIVEVVYCNSLFDRSYNLAKELMEKYPDLKMIAGMNEYSSVGAARAVKEAEAKDRIATVGIDSSQEAVQLMEQGVFKAFVVQKAFKMGYLGVKETILHLEGKKEEKNIDSGCELITPENMYNSDMEKLLFPFNTKKNT